MFFSALIHLVALYSSQVSTTTFAPWVDHHRGPVLLYRPGMPVPTEKDIEAQDEHLLRLSRKREEARDLVMSGQLRKAQAILERLMPLEPNPGVLPLLADVYLREGRYDLAYRLTAPVVATEINDSVLMAASLAAAHRGEVYEGQSEYCIDRILRFGASWFGKEYLPSDGSPKSVEFLSAVGMAIATPGNRSLDKKIYYLTLANRLRPNNPLVLYELAYTFRVTHKPDLEEKALRIVLANCPAQIRELTERRLRDLDYQKRLHRQ